jgi:acetyl esterase/lipase
MRTLPNAVVHLTKAVAIAAMCWSWTSEGVAAPGSGYTRTADLAYGQFARQKLDVYAPTDRDAAKLRPVVVFFYGGGWEIGRRERYRFVAKALTREGLIAVVPDYRVYPDAVFPDFVFDAAKAMRWTKDNIAHFGGDPGRMFVMGHSAGAHIAALLTLDPAYLKSVDMAPAQLRGMIGLAGMYDFLPLRNERLEFIFGPEPDRWRSQPINFVDGSNPPMLLVTGDDDGTVPPRNTHRLAAKIRAANGRVAVIEYRGMGHTEVLTALATSWIGKVRKAVAAFVREN